MAPPARLELTTLRLGGVRSIQVSYGGVCSSIVPKKNASVNENATLFLPLPAYNGKMISEGSKKYGTKWRILGCGRLHLCRPGLVSQWKIEEEYRVVLLGKTTLSLRGAKRRGNLLLSSAEEPIYRKVPRRANAILGMTDMNTSAWSDTAQWQLS